MEFVGVPLGIAVALLWGSADSVAALATRHLGALRTTFISQAAGLLVLTGLDAFVPTFWPSYPPSTFGTALLLGAAVESVGRSAILPSTKGSWLGLLRWSARSPPPAPS